MIAKPSKRAASFMIIAIAVVISIIIISRNTSTNAKKISGELIAGQKISIPDNPAWQSDFDQINKNISVSNYSLDSVSEDSSSTDTITDSVSKSLISNYLSLKEGGNLNNDSAKKLIDQTVDYVNIAGSQVPKTPTIKTILENNTDNIKNYGDLLGAILKEVAESKKVVDERLLIKTSLQTNNPEDLKKLDAVIDSYQTVADNMKEMPVPKILSEVHINMLVGINSVIFGLKGIQSVNTDPIKGLYGIKEYQNGAEKFITAMKQTILFLKANGIDYKQGSGGYYLLKGL